MEPTANDREEWRTLANKLWIQLFFRLTQTWRCRLPEWPKCFGRVYELEENSTKLADCELTKNFQSGENSCQLYELDQLTENLSKTFQNGEDVLASV